MRVSVCLGAILIPEYLDSHSRYSAPRSRIAGIYSEIYSYSRIFPNERALNYFIEGHCGSSVILYNKLLCATLLK